MMMMINKEKSCNGGHSEKVPNLDKSMRKI